MSEVQLPNKQLFYQQVWAQVQNIPTGKVATYGQIAKLVPVPEGINDMDYQMYGPRWAGLAIASCPDDVPWQRVINSQGKISHPSEAAKQKQLLQSEGVLFIKDKIDLREYQWLRPENNNDKQGRLF